MARPEAISLIGRSISVSWRLLEIVISLTVSRLRPSREPRPESKTLTVLAVETPVLKVRAFRRGRVIHSMVSTDAS